VTYRPRTLDNLPSFIESGRNAYPSGITPSTIMSPTRRTKGSRTEIRLGARAHNTRITCRAHAPPRLDRFKQHQLGSRA